jgi:hypothetical protein
LRTGNHGIRLVIIFETFQYRVPIQFAVQLHGNMLEQTGGTRAMGYLCRGDVVLTAANTFQPFTVMIRAFILLYGILGKR